MPMNPLANEKAVEMYNSIPQYIKDDLGEAYKWAVTILGNREGYGHSIQILPNYPDETVCCNFSKASWSGDHTGSGMDTGSEAIVMSVCEYLNGC